MASILCYEAEAAKGLVRNMKVISFENDMDSLKLAMTHKNRFEYLRHSGPDAVLARGTWQSRQYPGLSWDLHVGDFWQLASKASAAPDIIYYDFFSQKTNPDSWELESFDKLFSYCDPKKSAQLFTYCSSTTMRVALLNAGFYVANGEGTGSKKETIVALSPGFPTPCPYPLVGHEWLERWRRSSKKFPDGLTAEQQAEVEKRIEGHAQFSV